MRRLLAMTIACALVVAVMPALFAAASPSGSSPGRGPGDIVGRSAGARVVTATPEAEYVPGEVLVLFKTGPAGAPRERGRANAAADQEAHLRAVLQDVAQRFPSDNPSCGAIEAIERSSDASSTIAETSW